MKRKQALKLAFLQTLSAFIFIITRSALFVVPIVIMHSMLDNVYLELAIDCMVYTLFVFWLLYRKNLFKASSGKKK